MMPPNSPGKTNDSRTGGAESGAVEPDLPPEVAKIVVAWPKLMEAIRRAMLAMIE